MRKTPDQKKKILENVFFLIEYSHFYSNQIANTSSIFIGSVWKFPDIVKANDTANQRQKIFRFAVPVSTFSFWVINKILLLRT